MKSLLIFKTETFLDGAKVGGMVNSEYGSVIKSDLDYYANWAH